MKNLFKAVFLILIVFAACSKSRDNDVQIRVKNVSSVNYNEVLVSNHAFGDLPVGEVSAYQEFDYAYRYAYVRLKADGVAYELQPIDFVGEKKLTKGKYTYELSMDAEYKRVEIKLVKD